MRSNSDNDTSKWQKLSNRLKAKWERERKGKGTMAEVSRVCSWIGCIFKMAMDNSVTNPNQWNGVFRLVMDVYYSVNKSILNKRENVGGNLRKVISKSVIEVSKKLDPNLLTELTLCPLFFKTKISLCLALYLFNLSSHWLAFIFWMHKSSDFLGSKLRHFLSVWVLPTWLV